MDRQTLFVIMVSMLAFATFALAFNSVEIQDSTSGVPMEIIFRTNTPSQYGNLTQYKLVINCTLADKLESAPAISCEYLPITPYAARMLAKDLFGMDSINYEESSTESTYLKQGNQALEFSGLSSITYHLLSYRAPVIESWDEAWVRRYTDAFLEGFEPYWGFETDATRRFFWVGAVGWESPGDTEHVIKVEARYVWSVQGIDIVGTESDIRVIADGKIVSAAVTKPVVKIIDQQRVTVTPEQALHNFLDGWDVNSVIGEHRKKPNKPVNGTLVIDSVKPVYYLVEVSDTQRVPVLVYQIHARILYEGEEGPDEIDLYDYQYVN